MMGLKLNHVSKRVPDGHNQTHHPTHSVKLLQLICRPAAHFTNTD